MKAKSKTGKAPAKVRHVPTKKSAPKATAKPAGKAPPKAAVAPPAAAKKAAKAAPVPPSPSPAIHPPALGRIKAKGKAKEKAAPAAVKPTVRTMTKRDFEHFRKLLLQKQEEMTEAYRVSKGDSRTNLDNGTEDYIDYAVNSYAKEFLLSLNEMDRKQLLLVREALRRIDRGEFGLCLQCGQEIVRRRLEVAPWARHCVRCQELEEQGLLTPAAYPADGDTIHDAGLGLEDDEYASRLHREEEVVDTDDEEEEEEEAEEEVDEEPIVEPVETVVIEGDEEE